MTSVQNSNLPIRGMWTNCEQENIQIHSQLYVHGWNLNGAYTQFCSWWNTMRSCTRI